jgi:hypothetical protein
MDYVVNIKKDRGKRELNKLNPLKTEIIPVKTDYIDITFSCDYIYQFMFENKIISRKFQNITLIFTYCSLIISTLTVLFFMGFIQPPYEIYEYSCYDIKTDSYEACTYRNFCICESYTNCVITCFDSDEDVCRAVFMQQTKHNINDLFTTKNFGNQIYLKFNMIGSLGLFDNIETDYCYLIHYTVKMFLIFFIGAFSGDISVGIITDRFGKRLLIIISAVFLFLIKLTMAIRLFLIELSIELFPFFIFWYLISFLLGFFIYPFRSMLLKLFYENYGDTNYLHGINGFLHSYMGFVILFYFIFKTVFYSYNYFLLFCCVYYIVFIIVFLIYFTETPRYYSERRDMFSKKKCFEKMLDKLLVVRKKENGEVEKFYKVFKFFDSNIEKIYNEQIVDKQLDTEEIDKFQEERKFMVDAFKNEGNIAKRKEFKNKIKIDLLRKQQMEKKNSLKTILNLKNESLQITFKTIYNRFKEDTIIPTVYPMFFLCWLSIILTYYSILASFVLDITNPNSPNYKDVRVLVYNIIMNFIMPNFICRLSYYVNSDKIIFVCLLIISILCIIEDVKFISPALERNIFFGTKVEREKSIVNNTFNKSTIQFILMIVYALFNLNSLTVVPTLYRGTFYSLVQASTHIAAVIAFATTYILNTPILLMGVISLLNCLLFYHVVKETEVRLKEYIDDTNAYKPITYKNKDKSKNKAFKSIFSKFRHYSSKHFKNKKIE